MYRECYQKFLNLEKNNSKTDNFIKIKKKCFYLAFVFEMTRCGRDQLLFFLEMIV